MRWTLKSALLSLLNFNWNILNKFTRCTLFNDCAINEFNYWFMWFILLNTIVPLKSQAQHTQWLCFCTSFMGLHLTTTDQALAWLPWYTCKSFPIPYTRISLTTLFPLARLKCIGLRIFFFLCHYRKVSSNKRMHFNRITIRPHIINLFAGHAIYFCALPIYFVLALPSSKLSVQLFLSFKEIQLKIAALHRFNLPAITTAH